MRRLGQVSHKLRRVLLASLSDVPTDRLLLVACSGGSDSLALAAVTGSAGRPAGAVVVDHGLQPDSAAVSATAAEQCRELGLDPVLVARVSVVAGGGPEAAARRARYAALERAAEGEGAAAVLLGHTLDDQAESVLLGLARGSGTRSLAGMPEVRGRFRRPWLSQPRSRVRTVLSEFGMLAWDDPHNADPALRRARVRHRVLPVLADALGPGTTAALARTARLARQDADALDAWAESAHHELGDPPWSVAAVAALPAAVRGRLLRGAAVAAGCPPSDLTEAHVAEVDRLLTDWHGQGPVTLPGRILAARRCGRLALGDLAEIGAADGSG